MTDSMEFKFPDTDGGILFANAIKKVVSRKQGRNNLYSENWLNKNRITYHTDRINSKAERIKQAENLFFKGEIDLQKLMDVLEEEAGDVAVYSLFVLAKIERLKAIALKEGCFPMKGSGITFYLTEEINWKEVSDGEG